MRDFQEKARLDWVGSFAYSREEGTPAYAMRGRVPKKVVEARRKEVEGAQERITREALERFVGRETDVLVEERVERASEEEESLSLGRAWNQAPDVDGPHGVARGFRAGSDGEGPDTGGQRRRLRRAAGVAAMGNDLPPYLSSLNPEQLAAVKHEGKGLLILAGAGSGKTRVITTKIAYLVREKGIEPESILAVTFTNKAAREMRDRAAAIESECSRAVMRTFHSFGAWFLRRNAQAAGLDSNFTIYDDDDQTTLLHGAMPQNSRSECKSMVQAISRAKDLGLEPDSPDLSAAFLGPRHAPRLRPLRAEAAQHRERRLRRPHPHACSPPPRRRGGPPTHEAALPRHPRRRVPGLQHRPIRAPAPPGRDGAYICVVGDDDQSIYRFRGAEVRNILTFPQIFPGTDIIKLERNYRSYQSILDVAGDVVSHNSGPPWQEACRREDGRQ